ncbi:MAG: hypothetical protein A2Z65_13620 [Gallionellales bacterium RIFCSPLOWO2_02_58_13]|nr:MAG: hypothetical protein A2Z65_13620 [Gallionellales bacterium RIFCSPLOWO2_02_58_13]
MENDNQKTVEIRAASQQEVMPLLALAAGDDVQGLGLDAIIAGCQFYILDGLPGAEMAYALRAAGSELWIQAGGGKASVDLTALGLAAIERQAQGGFRSVGFQTRRRGLVKKAMRAGYQIDGYIMRKVVSA